MGLGILCLETYWSDDVSDRRTVRGLLELLEANVDDLVAEHRHWAHKSDLQYYLSEHWNRDERYDVLYIASHGLNGSLFDEADARITMTWLANELAGTCEGRVVYLGGCETFKVTDAALKSFMKKTRAAAVVGYSRAVDWLESSQMELIVLSALAERGPGVSGVWERTPQDTLERVAIEHEGFIERLDWGYATSENDPNRSRRASPDGATEAASLLQQIAADANAETSDRLRALRSLRELRNPIKLRPLSTLAKSEEPVTLRVAAVAAIEKAAQSNATATLATLADHLSKAGASQADRRVLKAVRSAHARR